MLYTVGALARRLGVPFRSGGSLCASKLPDAQAAYESASTLLPTVMGGVNFVLHAAGWLEGGLAVGYEKFVLDCDQLGMMSTFVKGLDHQRERPGARCDPREHAGQPLPRHGPHARQLRDRVLPVDAPPTTPASSSGARRAGSTPPNAPTRIWKEQLAAYEAPPIDDAVDEELRDYIDRRRAELPDAFE